MRNNRIIIFLLLTFIWSWVNWGVALYFLKNTPDEDGLNYFIPFFFIGVYGPTLAAIITTVFFEGSVGLRALLKRLLMWQISPKVYLAIFALPVLFTFFGIWIYDLFVLHVGNFSTSKITSIPFVLGTGLLAGPLGEELGWRGYLLPGLQKMYSSSRSGILIGIVLFCWHIPLFFAPFGALVSNGQISALNVSIYFVATICLSSLFTRLSNLTSGSVFVAIVAHTFVNAGLGLVFFPTLNTSESHRSVFTFSMIPLILFTIYFVLKDSLRFKEKY